MAERIRETLGRLEERCRGQGIRLLYGELMGEGGLCRLYDRHIIIINRRTSTATRARIIADALARLDAEPALPGPARAAAADRPEHSMAERGHDVPVPVASGAAG